MNNKLIVSFDQDAFWALLKEAFKKAISEMPTDYIKCEIISSKNPCKEIEITISSKIMVDECIADEIVRLNSLGVRTRHSCCGHGKENAYAIIEPGYRIPERAKELGYGPYFSDPNEDGRGFTVIDLKSKCQCDTD